MHSPLLCPPIWLMVLVLSGCGGLHQAITVDNSPSSSPPGVAADQVAEAVPHGVPDNVRAEWPGQSPVRLPEVVVGAESSGDVKLAGYLPSDTADMDIILRLPPTEASSGGITYRDLIHNQWEGIVSDHRQFYSLPTMTWLAAGLGVGAAMANTPFDETFIHDIYAENVLLAPSHEYSERFHEAKFLGDGYYTIPAFAVLALSEPLIDELPYGPTGAEWGQRSLRTILVGGPPMLGLQYLTGASRPGESSGQSAWKPFADNNGLSGHAFMGAIPFLSAAKMTDNWWAKSGLYAASTLPALSRVNDEGHYLSQACLGWWVSYLAASAVDRSYHHASNANWFWFSNADAQGLAIELRR